MVTKCTSNRHTRKFWKDLQKHIDTVDFFIEPEQDPDYNDKRHYIIEPAEAHLNFDEAFFSIFNKQKRFKISAIIKIDDRVRLHFSTC